MGTYSGVLRTVDQLIIDNSMMDEVRNLKSNSAIASKSILHEKTRLDDKSVPVN